MKRKVIVFCAAISIFATPVMFAQTKSNGEQNSGNMITVEEAYLNSIEGVMIKEMVSAEGRDSKIVALQYIEDALNEGRKTEEIQAALSSLATVGISSVVQENGRVINNYPDIRRKACELLGKMGTVKSKDVLVAVMYTDNEPSVISAAVKALGTIGINENDEVSDMINWIARKFDTVNPTSSLALDILNTFERMSGSIANKRDMIETIMRIANNYSYVTPVRTKAHDLVRKISSAEQNSGK
ncbi:MAG: HEAT repeat domain-containing protein [Treponema sp.]|uniref:HEAT repeat domain-containing protein n=1 Tax=Treponema sp. TaxID=166 RepID=UPI003FA2F64F